MHQVYDRETETSLHTKISRNTQIEIMVVHTEMLKAHCNIRPSAKVSRRLYTSFSSIYSQRGCSSSQYFSNTKTLISWYFLFICDSNWRHMGESEGPSMTDNAENLLIIIITQKSASAWPQLLCWQAIGASKLSKKCRLQKVSILSVCLWLIPEKLIFLQRTKKKPSCFKFVSCLTCFKAAFVLFFYH